MKKIVLLIFISLIILPLLAQTYLDGTPVFAEWMENDWYHGRIDGQCSDGYMILFDDGDTKCCRVTEIVADVIPVSYDIEEGTPVLAQWNDGRFFPGVAVSGKDGKYNINYFDGDTSVVFLEQIRVMDALPPAAVSLSQESTQAQEPFLDEAIKIWKGNSQWAEITEYGSIRIGGIEAGELDVDGDIYVNGTHIGELTGDGDIWISGQEEGEIEMSGRFWRSGSVIGSINVNGDIYLHRSKWGEAQPINGDYSKVQIVAVMLAFFEPDFGFIQ